MKEEDLKSVSVICKVSLKRSRELLEASSGCVSRAVEIHLSQPRHNSCGADLISIEDDENNDDDTRSAAVAGGHSHVDTASVGAGTASHNKDSIERDAKNPPVAKKARAEKKASPKKQGTLHTFLGLPKPKTSRQLKVSSFFAKKEEEHKEENCSSGAAVKMETHDQEIASVKMETHDQEIVHSRQSQKQTVGQGKTSQSSPEEKPTINRDRQTASDNQPKIKAEGEPKIGRNTENENFAEYGNGNSPHGSPSPASIASTRARREPSSKGEQVDPRLRYNVLAQAFADATGTTKRNEKLNILKSVLMGVIEAVGGIHGDSLSREEHCHSLICALELICGKISLSTKPEASVETVALQVSGAAVSKAVQTVTGASKNRLREVYRETGDMGDCAAEMFSPGQSVKNFFVANKSKVTDQCSTTDGASIRRIHALLQSVATVKPGTGSQQVRQNLLLQLLRLSTSKQEIRFLVRTLIGNMRLGATIKSILASLAMAVREVQTKEPASTQDPAIQLVQKTFDVCPRLPKIATSLLCGGFDRMVEECTLEVLVPIQPMLANPAHALEEVEKLMAKSSGATSFEWKLDGVRCQAHCKESDVKLFSRHLQETTAQFPDAVQFMMEARRDKNAHSFIIDSEIVAVANHKENDEEVRLLPFQVLSTRRGTKNESNVKIRVYAFDLMYYNGTSLLSKPLWERQQMLRDNFKESRGFAFVQHMSLSSFDETKITTYLQEAVHGGAEGLMVKLLGNQDGDSLQSTNSENVPPSLPCLYESGTRSATWLKLKRDYVSGFADTIDVVPIGAWYGNGRKAEKKFLSPVLLAVYDEDDGVFRSISRCMSFTDDVYTATREFYFNGRPYPQDVAAGASAEQKMKDGTADVKVESGCQDNIIEEDQNEDDDLIENSEDEDGDDMNKAGIDTGFIGANCFGERPSSSIYVTNENCTIWFKPCEVWEVSFADLTLSKTHTACAGFVDDAEGRGVALRFPRFKRRRPDKGPEQATTTTQIAQLYNQQSKQH